MEIAVVDPMGASDDVAQRVVKRRPGQLHRQAGQVGAHERLAPSGEVVGGVSGGGQRRREGADRLLGQPARDRVGARPVERLDAVREGVQARRCGEPPRHTGREGGVVDHDAGEGPRVACGGLLVPGDAVGGRGLRAGIRRGNGDQGQPGAHGHRFAESRGGAAADGDQPVGLDLVHDLCGVGDVGLRHVLHDLGLADHDQRAEALGDPVGGRLGRAGRHEHHLPEPERRHLRRDVVEPAHPEDHPLRMQVELEPLVEGHGGSRVDDGSTLRPGRGSPPPVSTTGMRASHRRSTEGRVRGRCDPEPPGATGEVSGGTGRDPGAGAASAQAP